MERFFTLFQTYKKTQKGLCALKGAHLFDCEKFVPKITVCKVVKVYDGDTITIATYLPNDKCLYRFTVRLRSVNTPELHTDKESEEKAAQFVREKLKTKILNKIVYLSNIGYDKYGRLLATIYVTLEDFERNEMNYSVNQWLLTNHYAVIYGEDSPDNWLEYMEIK